MNPFLRRLFARPRTVTRPTPKAPRRALLRLSTLEDRATPATFTVTSAGDTGTGVGLTGDLRYCITQANDPLVHPGADTIVFDQTPGGVFGGFISEPPGATYHDPKNGVPVRSGPVADIHTEAVVSPDLIVVPGFISHLDLQWTDLGFSRFLRKDDVE